jgi:Flp pilus assembly protein TadD/TolB-like protein
MTLASGSRLGTYEVLDSLGAGGMGEVYRARDTNLQRDVAIKILPDASADDAKRLARFEREARLLAALNHPSIATIYGLEHSESRRYIVMELVPGETLADRLAAGPLPVDEAIRIGRQIAEGLEAAHARGVIHCDLKPSNIALTPDGRVKLLDFGLARAFALDSSSEELSRSPTVTSELAAPGVVSGTVPYMSPEQARGRDIDKRTDIWAFGCVLYEMLTGRRAFTGGTIAEILAAIFETDPDWGPLPGKTPANVRELLRHCTQKDPNRRLRDIGDARIELEDTYSGQTRPFPEPPLRRPRVNRRWMVALAAVALATALGVYRSLPKPNGARPGTRQLAVLPFRNLTGTAEGELMGLAMAETVSARLANVPGLQVVTPRAAVEAMDRDSNFARVARLLGANTLLAGSLQREKDRFRITYRLVDAGGNQLAANAIDGLELFSLQDRVADGVVRDLLLRRGARRTPTPSGLDTVSEQERYLQAIGLLQRYDKRDGVERSVQILEKLAREKPRSPLVQAALGRASLAMFDFTKDKTWADRAISASETARGLDPDLPEVDITVGQTLLATGRPKEAAVAFRRALAANPDKVEALLGLGNAANAAGDPITAENALKRAVALQPSFGAYNQLGAFYAESNRWSEAAQQLRQTVRLWPDSPRALGNLGGVLMNGCDAAGALDVLRKAVAIHPNDPFVTSNLGLTQLWTGHSAEAVASLERATRGAPNDYQIWSNLGDAYRSTPGSAARAQEAYARSVALARDQLRINAQDAEARAAIATGLAKTGHTAEASEEIRKALAIEDKSADVLADAAAVAALDGRAADALDWLRKAVGAGYCRTTIARQPEFASLRDNPEFRSIIAAPRSAAGS